MNWDAYGEAAELLDLGFKYNHLVRCFTLYSRGFFTAEASKEQKRVSFFFRSQEEQQRDAVSLIYSILKDDVPIPDALTKFLRVAMPVINTVFPSYIDKTSEISICYQTPPDMLAYFKDWARLQANAMPFDLPSEWHFGAYSLAQFRFFWMSLLAASLAHITAHGVADAQIGTRGGAIGSLVMEMNEAALLRIGEIFPIPMEAMRSLLNLLVYEPKRNFWDPFWQPIIAVSGGQYLVAPHLIITSSPERNLITLLNRSAPGRAFYNRVSSQKEMEQLNGLCQLFPSPRFVVRKRVAVNRSDGSTLTDVDLMVYEATAAVLLLVHAKWLIGPDSVQEVLSKDEEVKSALAIAAKAASRIAETGTGWLSAVLDAELRNSLEIRSLIINRDFIPSGWVYDQRIPIVNTDFVTKFVRSPQFTGLDSLYAACAGFYEHLVKRHPIKLDREEIRYGDYLFDFPTVEQGN